MAVANIDDNRKPTILGTSNADGSTPLNVYVDSSTNRLLVSSTTDLGQTEDTPHTTGDTGTMTLAVRNDTLASLVSADGDYAPIQVNASGAIYIQEGAALDVSAEIVTVDATGQGDIPITLDGEIVTANIEADASVTGLDTVFESDGDNTAQEIKASAGNLYALEVSNPNSADAYLQLFDVATGSVTVGTTTPKLSLFIPAGDGTKDGAMDKTFTVPITFATAITYACTTTATGSGDPTTGLIVNAMYK